MVLALVDDLMFRSKIKSAATQAGADVKFFGTRDGALNAMRDAPPALVILDLNNPRADPIGIVTTMKSEPSLASVPTLGYVSHVDTATIDAARAAGVDEVLARSAFTMRLAEIIGGSTTRRP